MRNVPVVFLNTNLKLNDYRVYPLQNGHLLVFIRPLDNERQIFEILELDMKDYFFIESQIGIHKEDLEEDERYIFPFGRSRSKYLNAYNVLKYMGKNANSSREACANIEDLFESTANFMECDVAELVYMYKKSILELKKIR